MLSESLHHLTILPKVIQTTTNLFSEKLRMNNAEEDLYLVKFIVKDLKFRILCFSARKEFSTWRVIKQDETGRNREL